MHPPLSMLAVVLAVLFATPTSADNLKIGYIHKMGDHPWFVAEIEGARAKAQALGVEFVSQDVQFDANLAMTTLDTMIGDGVAGIAIVVPDRGIGPMVAAKATAANIPFVAVDDAFTFQDGTPVPYVGLDGKQIGRMVGQELGKRYRAQGWDRRDVKVVSIEDPRADSCMQRNLGAQEAFLAAAPEFNSADILHVSYENNMVSAVDVMTTTLIAHPEISHWVFYSCNDDGVLGAARALENSGYAAFDGLGIGIDGSRACDAFGSGMPSSFRGTMWLNSFNHGAAAVELLVKAVRDGAEIPQVTYSQPELITADNFDRDYKTRLCK